MDTTEILIKIRQIIRSINLESKKIQKDYGVSIPQVLCLGFLKKADNYQATQSEIKQYLNLNSSTVSGIINRLEKKGFIARLPKLGDKRVVNIALTSVGFEVVSSIPLLLHDRLSGKLKGLPLDQLKQIEESLDTIVKLLDVTSVEASPVIAIDVDLDE
jgi:DNA-binding MarR family transcriptional regulator